MSIGGIPKEYHFREKWYIKGGKGLDLWAEPPRIKICCRSTPRGDDSGEGGEQRSKFGGGGKRKGEKCSGHGGGGDGGGNKNLVVVVEKGTQ